MHEPVLGTHMTDDKGVVMVYVPTGKFLMGSTSEQLETAFAHDQQEYGDKVNHELPTLYLNELPQHEVVVTRAFWLDLTPVTNESYAHFIREDGYSTELYWTPEGWQWARRTKDFAPINYGETFNDPQQPRVGITWYEAYAYCQWRGGRLPTEAEWEWAARGTQNLIYPWGDQFDPAKLVWNTGADGRSAWVGSKPAGASWVGALDMSGNIWEWLQTIFDQDKYPYPYRENDGRNTDHSINDHVMRGGSWNSKYTSFFRTANRSWFAGDFAGRTWGVRAARSV